MQKPKSKGKSRKKWVEGEVTDQIKREARIKMREIFTLESLTDLKDIDWRGKARMLIDNLESINPRWRQFDGRFMKNTNPIFKWIYTEIKNHFKRLEKQDDSVSMVSSQRGDQELQVIE